MYYVYILKSELDGRYYIGHTSNIEKRVEKHNAGQVRSTKYRRPFALFTSTTCTSKKEALALEKYLKSLKKPEAAIKYIRALSSIGRAPGS